MKRIKEYYQLHEAYIDKSILDEAGIESFISNENSNTIKPDGYTPTVFLAVREDDINKAIEVLTAPLN